MATNVSAATLIAVAQVRAADAVTVAVSDRAVVPIERAEIIVAALAAIISVFVLLFFDDHATAAAALSPRGFIEQNAADHSRTNAKRNVTATIAATTTAAHRLLNARWLARLNRNARAALLLHDLGWWLRRQRRSARSLGASIRTLC